MEQGRLAELFRTKITFELEGYRKKMLRQEPGVIFGRAYQIDCMVSIYELLLEYSQKMEPEVLEILLTLPHLLASFYRRWLKYEDMHTEELQECLGDGIAKIQTGIKCRETAENVQRKTA